jgi:hypothetical protein
MQPTDACFTCCHNFTLKTGPHECKRGTVWGREPEGEKKRVTEGMCANMIEVHYLPV